MHELCVCAWFERCAKNVARAIFWLSLRYIPCARSMNNYSQTHVYSRNLSCVVNAFALIVPKSYRTAWVVCHLLCIWVWSFEFTIFIVCSCNSIHSFRRHTAHTRFCAGAVEKTETCHSIVHAFDVSEKHFPRKKNRNDMSMAQIAAVDRNS